MPAISSDPQPLYRIDECSDLMADACVCGDQGDLIFLSVWARDTAIQQFIGRLTLGRSEDGLDQFHVVTDQGGSLPVFVGSVERLEKRLTRSYRRTLFGSLVNLWLFDRRCIRPDKATTSALALHRVGWWLFNFNCIIKGLLYNENINNIYINRYKSTDDNLQGINFFIK